MHGLSSNAAYASFVCAAAASRPMSPSYALAAREAKERALGDPTPPVTLVSACAWSLAWKNRAARVRPA